MNLKKGKGVFFKVFDFENEIERILISEEQIVKRTRELGEMISRDYYDKDLVLVGVLKGCFVFLSDLFRNISIHCTVDFMDVSSYEPASTVSSGIVRILKDLDDSIENKHVLIIEDIVDTGTTLKYLLEFLKSRKPASIKTATLFNKPARRTIDIEAEYIGFDIPNEFIIGYGLDFNEKYRNLPYVGILKKEFYSRE